MVECLEAGALPLPPGLVIVGHATARLLAAVAR
jgi:hypothetical protein